MFDDVDEQLDESDPQPEIEIVTPSGSTLNVLTLEEKEQYEELAQRYQTDNAFTNVSDLKDLDLVLFFELMCYRFSSWVSSGEDYNGDPVFEDNCNRQIRSFSTELRLLKKSLGIDKSSRDKSRDASAADYLANLRLRALEFGVHRNNQAVAAITALKEIEGKYTFYKNSNDAERREFHIEAEDFFAWLESKFDEFNMIDEEFKQTSQKYWIREV